MNSHQTLISNRSYLHNMLFQQKRHFNSTAEKHNMSYKASGNIGVEP
jgi:hypothetical protein